MKENEHDDHDGASAARRCSVCLNRQLQARATLNSHNIELIIDKASHMQPRLMQADSFTGSVAQTAVWLSRSDYQIQTIR